MSKAINKLNEKEKEKEKIRLLFAQREKFYRILENPEQGFTPPTALLKSGETCFLIDYVNMGEVVTESVRTYTGTRLKLGSTPVYLGGGKSVANEKQKNVAYGELVLTNFRLIFVGNMRSIEPLPAPALPISGNALYDLAVAVRYGAWAIQMGKDVSAPLKQLGCKQAVMMWTVWAETRSRLKAAANALEALNAHADAEHAAKIRPMLPEIRNLSAV